MQGSSRSQADLRARSGRMLSEGHLSGAEAMLGRLRDIFDDRLYVEIMRHGMPEELQIETDLIDLAYRFGSTACRNKRRLFCRSGNV